MTNHKADTKAPNGLSGAADNWPRSARDFAADIGVSERTIRRAIYRGDLLATKHSGVFRIARHDADAYLLFRDSIISPNGHAPSTRSPLSVDENVAASLPPQLTSLVGREGEGAYLVSLLTNTGKDRIRLLTLTGTGGVGKTRLAIWVADQVARQSRLDACFVSLATVFDPGQVAPAIARTLGVHVTEHDDLIARIGNVLNRKSSLLVLDNFEQVVEAAPVVVDLLRHCPDVALLVTSRMSLHVSGEHEHVVQPLSLDAAPGESSLSTSTMPEAVRLFYDRARAVRENFDPDELHVQTISEICRRVDGLPLGIELAASRVRALDPKTLLAQLENRLPLLTGGNRDAPLRQQEMRQTIDWSYNLLTPNEQGLFRSLGIFVGGCTLEAAQAICGNQGAEQADQNPVAILDGIASLVDKNLLRLGIHSASEDKSPRYTMLETIREYARDALKEHGETSEIQVRHIRYFTDFVERTAPLLQWQHNTAESVKRLDADYDNIMAALDSSLNGERACFLRMAAAMQSYWCLRGRIAEGKSWLIQAVHVCSGAPASLRSSVFRSAGWLAWFASDFEDARLLFTEGLELARATGEQLAIAHALSGLGFVAQDLGAFARAREYFEEALEIGRHLDSRVWQAWSARNIGDAMLRSGDSRAAEPWMNEALTLFSEIDHKYGVAQVMSNLSRIAREKGQLIVAAALVRPQLSTSWHESALCWCLEDLAEIATECGLYIDATRLYGAIDAHRIRLGGPGNPSALLTRDRYLLLLKSTLEPDQFETAWREGSALSSNQARAEGLDMIDRISATYPKSHGPRYGAEGLTRREVEILRLVAGNRTNKQIATALYISIPTVKRHMTNILGKLDTRDRASAVDLARSRGLI